MLYAALAQSPVLGGKVSRSIPQPRKKCPACARCMITSSGVAVVADHFWQALKARNAVRVTWDPAPTTRLDNAAIRALLKKTAAAGDGLSARADGNAAAALKSAKRTLSAALLPAPAGARHHGAHELHR